MQNCENSVERKGWGIINTKTILLSRGAFFLNPMSRGVFWYFVYAGRGSPQSLQEVIFQSRLVNQIRGVYKGIRK